MNWSNGDNFCALPWLHRIINLSQPWYKFCCVSPNMPIDSIAAIADDRDFQQVKEQLYKTSKEFLASSFEIFLIAEDTSVFKL